MNYDVVIQNPDLRRARYPGTNLGRDRAKKSSAGVIGVRGFECRDRVADGVSKHRVLRQPLEHRRERCDQRWVPRRLAPAPPAQRRSSIFLCTRSVKPIPSPVTCRPTNKSAFSAAASAGTTAPAWHDNRYPERRYAGDGPRRLPAFSFMPRRRHARSAVSRFVDRYLVRMGHQEIAAGCLYHIGVYFRGCEDTDRRIYRQAIKRMTAGTETAGRVSRRTSTSG